MYSTKYVKPDSTSEALEAIKSLGEGKFLAGGMTLIPTLKQRLASPDGLVDISGCKLDSNKKGYTRISETGRRYRRPPGKKSGYTRGVCSQ